MARKMRDITGNRVGLLTVVERAKDGARGKSYWTCQCDCGNKITLSGSDINNQIYHSCGCVDEKEFKLKPKKKEKLSEEILEKRKELYQYVHDKLMKYNENMPLTKRMVLQLYGLVEGKHFANNKVEGNAKYTYDEVLATCKFCALDITYATDNKTFKSDDAKFTYMIAIIRNNLNTVKQRLDDAEKQKAILKRKEERLIKEYNYFESKRSSA